MSDAPGFFTDVPTKPVKKAPAKPAPKVAPKLVQRQADPTQTFIDQIGYGKGGRGYGQGQGVLQPGAVNPVPKAPSKPVVPINRDTRNKIAKSGNTQDYQNALNNPFMDPKATQDYYAKGKQKTVEVVDPIFGHELVRHDLTSDPTDEDVSQMMQMHYEGLAQKADKELPFAVFDFNTGLRNSRPGAEVTIKSKDGKRDIPIRDAIKQLAKVLNVDPLTITKSKHPITKFLNSLNASTSAPAYGRIKGEAMDEGIGKAGGTKLGILDPFNTMPDGLSFTNFYRAQFEDQPQIANDSDLETYGRSLVGVVNPFTTSRQFTGQSREKIGQASRMTEDVANFIAQMAVTGGVGAGVSTAEKLGSAGLRALVFDAPQMGLMVKDSGGVVPAFKGLAGDLVKPFQSENSQPEDFLHAGMAALMVFGLAHGVKTGVGRGVDFVKATGLNRQAMGEVIMRSADSLKHEFDGTDRNLVNETAQRLQNEALAGKASEVYSDPKIAHAAASIIVYASKRDYVMHGGDTAAVRTQQKLAMSHEVPGEANYNPPTVPENPIAPISEDLPTATFRKPAEVIVNEKIQTPQIETPPKVKTDPVAKVSEGSETIAAQEATVAPTLDEWASIPGNRIKDLMARVTIRKGADGRWKSYWQGTSNPVEGYDVWHPSQKAARDSATTTVWNEAKQRYTKEYNGGVERSKEAVVAPKAPAPESVKVESPKESLGSLSDAEMARIEAHHDKRRRAWIDKERETRPNFAPDQESRKELLSPEQKAEIERYEDLNHRSVALQGPEKGYKPYKLTAREVAERDALRKKYRDLLYSKNGTDEYFPPTSEPSPKPITEPIKETPATATTATPKEAPKPLTGHEPKLDPFSDDFDEALSAKLDKEHGDGTPNSGAKALREQTEADARTHGEAAITHEISIESKKELLGDVYNLQRKQAKSTLTPEQKAKNQQMRAAGVKVNGGARSNADSDLVALKRNKNGKWIRVVNPPTITTIYAGDIGGKWAEFVDLVDAEVRAMDEGMVFVTRDSFQRNYVSGMTKLNGLDSSGRVSELMYREFHEGEASADAGHKQFIHVPQIAVDRAIIKLKQSIKQSENALKQMNANQPLYQEGPKLDLKYWDKTLREAEAKGANLDNAFAGFEYTAEQKKYLLAHAGVKHTIKNEVKVTESLFGGEDTLFQAPKSKPKGSYIWDEATQKGILTLNESADASTVIHELQHHFLQTASGQTKANIASWALKQPTTPEQAEKIMAEGSKNPRYVRIQESFAYATEQSLKGKSQVPPEIQEAMDAFRGYLGSVKQAFVPDKVNLNQKLEQQGKVDTFYSKLSKVLEDKLPGKASADQIRNTLLGAGVKPEEMKYSGMDDLLSRGGTFTKQELRDHLLENQVKIEEVVKGGSQRASLEKELADAKGKQQALSNRLWQIHETADKYAWSRNADELKGLSPVERKMVEEYAELDDSISSINQQLRDIEDSTGTKYDQYTLNGGENYRELLLTLPLDNNQYVNLLKKYQAKYGDEHGRWLNTDLTPEERATLRRMEDASGAKKVEQYRSSHWDEPNVLAHVRFDDRTGANGEKILHVAEIQSDWHQAGRKQGYRSDLTKDEANRLGYSVYKTKSNLGSEAYFLHGEGNNSRGLTTVGFESEGAAWDALLAHIKDRSSTVPDAPFKKTWHELAFKRMLRHAAENGYDKITWDTGATSADRYDLSKQVDSIQWESPQGKYVNAVGVRDVTIDMPNAPAIILSLDESGKVVNGTHPEFNGKSLDDIVGKDIAEKIMADESGDLSGDGLKVGGEGMKGFYDKILPDFANKYAKKWGMKVEPGTVDKVPVHSMTLTPEMRASVLHEGQPLFQGKKTKLTPHDSDFDKLMGEILGGEITADHAKAFAKEVGSVDEEVQKNAGTMTHAQTAVVREVLGAELYQKTVKPDEQTIKDAAKHRGKSQQFAARLDDGKPLSDSEQVALGLDYQDSLRGRQEILDKYPPGQDLSKEDAQALADHEYNALNAIRTLDKAGSEAGRSLRIRQLVLGNDYTNQGITAAFVKASGKMPDRAQSAKIAELTARIEELESKVNTSTKAKRVKYDDAVKYFENLNQKNVALNQLSEAERHANAIAIHLMESGMTATEAIAKMQTLTGGKVRGSLATNAVKKALAVMKGKNTRESVKAGEPTPREINEARGKIYNAQMELADIVAGEGLKTAWKEAGILGKTGIALRELRDSAVSVVSSTDFSGTRQALYGLLVNPKSSGRTFLRQFKNMKTSNYDEWIAGLQSEPQYWDALDNGLDIQGKPNFKEEAFRGRAIEKVPGIGQIVGASDRTYSTVTTGVRYEVYKTLAKYAKTKAEKALIADFANIVTGRAGSGKLKTITSGELPRSILWAPSFMASRMQHIALPVRILRSNASAGVKARLLGEWVKPIAAIGGIMAGVAQVTGGKFISDRDDKDFLAVILPDGTKYDPWAGSRQVVRLGLDMINPQRKGEWFDQGKDQIKRVFDFTIEGKSNPMFKTGMNLARRHDTIGGRFGMKEAALGFLPLMVKQTGEDAMDGMTQQEWVGFLGNTFGVFDLREKKSKEYYKKNREDAKADAAKPFLEYITSP